MLVNFMSYLPHLLGFLVVAYLVVVYGLSGVIQSRFFRTAFGTLRMPLAKPQSWSAVILLVAALLAFWGQIGWTTALLATGLVYVGLHASRTIMRRYGSQIQAAIGSRTLRVTTSLIAITATLAAVVGYWLERSPYSHADIRAAESHWHQLDMSRVEMQGSFSDIEREFDTFHVPRDQRIYTFAEIQALNSELKDLSEHLIKRLGTLLDQLHVYELSAVDAPAVFRKAAQVWRDYGRVERDEYHYPELAERYEEIAQLWDTYAEFFERHPKSPVDGGEIQEMIQFLERAHLMFVRFQENEPLNGLAAVEQLRLLEADLQQFVKKFDQLREAIRGLTRQLNDHGADLKPPAVDPLAAATPAAVVKLVSTTTFGREPQTALPAARPAPAFETASKLVSSPPTTPPKAVNQPMPMPVVATAAISSRPTTPPNSINQPTPEPDVPPASPRKNIGLKLGDYVPTSPAAIFDARSKTPVPGGNGDVQSSLRDANINRFLSRHPTQEGMPW